MLRDEQDPAAAGLRLIIKPNRSLSDRGAVLVLCATAVPVLTIGFAFYAIGLPLVLPFAGIEVLGLGAGLWWTARKLGVKEVVTIGSGRVLVERGRRYAEHRQEFDSAWVRVDLERPQHAWHANRLLLRSHGRELEIGQGLSDEERSALAARLLSKLHAVRHRQRSISEAESIMSMGDKHACT